MCIDNRMARFDGPLHLVFDPGHDGIESKGIAQIGEHKRQVASHFAGVALHHFEGRTHVRSEVNFIYYQQI
jgi:hypothetical protein